MCTETVTNLKLEAVDKLIAMAELDKQKLLLLKRGIRLDARLCASQRETPDDIAEHARLRRNQIRIQLDEANLDLRTAQHAAELRKIFGDINTSMREAASESVVSLLGSLFSKGSFGFPLGDDIGSLGGLDHSFGTEQGHFSDWRSLGLNPQYEDFGVGR